MAVNQCLLAALLGIALAAGMAAGPARAQENARGEALFELCATCHGAEAGGNRMFLAPAISGLAEWYVTAQLQKFRGGLRGTHFDDISGMRMRPMALTLANENDLQAVARYVASLPPVNPEPELVGGDAAKGQVTYALCGTCHGPAGEGLQPLNGPALAHASDWYLLEQLQKFKLGIRGADPRDPISIMMRPMAMTLVDEQAMKDVIAYIKTLSR